MKAILEAMIFFRKKKAAPVKTEKAPAKPKPAPKKAAAPKKAVKPEEPVRPAAAKPLQDIAHDRVLTAEGWRRLMAQQTSLKKKK